ncbi:MAG: site-specific DNA-methyltransferase [Nevskiaceae bacterium]|nr:MAG: site-specific DNA-methyltransferase [Nevskiaceae bacterium]
MAEKEVIETLGRLYGAANDACLDNCDLFDALVKKGVVTREELEHREPVGKSGKLHSVAARKLRWWQQDLRRLGLLERDPTKRGRWALTGKGKKQFTQTTGRAVLLGFSTDLGIALWGTCQEALARLDEPISLVLTSPPYCLAKERAYGGPKAQEWVDFILRCIEPLVKSLKRGGSIVLNIGNDSFISGSPARSTLTYRLVLELESKLSLSLVDTMVWWNASKPPGPIRYASLERVQLNSAWEPCFWFTNDAHALASDNRRVLMEHSERHLKLIKGGGEMREASYSDGAHAIRAGRSFSKMTEGRIPRNVLEFGHACKAQQAYKRRARALGLPAHGAPFPERLVEFLIKFMTEEGDLVVDPFSGSFTVPAVAERLNRRWVGVDTMGEYVRGGAERFTEAPGFELGPDLVEAMEWRTNPQLPLLLI